MQKFTSISEGKEAKEYNRQYVDEDSETADVVGYASGVDYEFDRYTNNPVQEMVARVTDDEIVGTDAQVEIVTVDVFADNGSGECPARKRTYSIVPDSIGDGTDALIYSGSLKAASEITKGYATTGDKWQTCTFTEGEIPAKPQESLAALNVQSNPGANVGNTAITVTPGKESGNSYKYKTAANLTVPVLNQVCSSGYTNWDGTTELPATTGQHIVIVELDVENKAKKAGMAVISAKV
ncbi:MAG: hypothetical protein RSB58_09245 [Clostridium sp.]